MFSSPVQAVTVEVEVISDIDCVHPFSSAVQPETPVSFDTPTSLRTVSSVAIAAQALIRFKSSKHVLDSYDVSAMSMLIPPTHEYWKALASAQLSFKEQLRV